MFSLQSTYSVEQGFSPHRDIEGDVKVRLVTASVELHIPGICDEFYLDHDHDYDDHDGRGDVKVRLVTAGVKLDIPGICDGCIDVLMRNMMMVMMNKMTVIMVMMMSHLDAGTPRMSHSTDL